MYSRTADELPPCIAGLPEVVQIFVDNAVRGGGVRRLLLEAVEESLAVAGKTGYFLKTLSAPTNRAIGFYDRIGFERLSTVAMAGDSYLFLIKRGSHAPQQAQQHGN